MPIRPKGRKRKILKKRQERTGNIKKGQDKEFALLITRASTFSWLRKRSKNRKFLNFGQDNSGKKSKNLLVIFIVRKINSNYSKFFIENFQKKEKKD